MRDIQAFARTYMERYTQYKNGWNYEDSCILVAAADLWQATGDGFYRDFAMRYMNRFVRDDGSIPSFELHAYSIDNIAPGRPLFFALEQTGEEKWRTAIEFHMNRLRTHPRCKCGNFWHKEIYPWQVWLDGLYMAQPFRMLYESRLNKNAEIADITAQFRVVREHLYNPEKGLYYHGWDESRQQPWCDKETGLSANFWSRAMGWYLMAMIDCIDFCDEQMFEHRQYLVELFREAVAGIRPWMDGETGLIYQVIDRADVPGNYLETSGSAMLCYALFKGVRLGVLQEDRWLPLARKAWNGLTGTKMITGADGETHICDMCRVAGLGPGDKRDGSVAYYLSEDRCCDEVKGVAAFLMAASEAMRAEA
ncbi:MAG: glycoside hydrolase family 88 protein [Clostridia bacterium]|nr:glycoside hydrolase family 88 protein [Clostridia bacterium]